MYLDSLAYSRDALEDSKTLIMDSLAEEGFIDVYDVLQPILEEEEVEDILFNQMNLEEVILEDNTLISSHFL